MIEINDNIYPKKGSADLDGRYGTYNSIAEALASIPMAYRGIGTTVGIMTAGEVVEYQFKAGIADIQLVPKLSFVVGSDKVMRAALADYALDSDKWDGREFEHYLDQPVRTTDDIRIKSITSTTYVSGAFGEGFKIDENGDAEFDNITVRKSLNVNELVLNKISGTNGALAVSDTIKIDSVTETPDGYDCTIQTEDNTIAVPFRINDLVRCQVWNGKAVKYYFAKITAITNDGFTIGKANKLGDGIPEKGDVVVRFGNTTDTDRQGLIYLTSSDTNAPYLDVLDEITSDDLSGKTKVRLGKLDGITDADLGTLTGYGIYGENAFIKGKIHVTGGNAQTIAGSQQLANIAQTTAITTATTLAEADATVKANAAQLAAITQAAQDAQTRASAAQEAAQLYADEKSAYEKELAQAYADGIVSDEEQARISDAEMKLQLAKNYADAQDEYERAVAQAYADGVVTAEEQARISDAEAKLQIAKDFATSTANSVGSASNSYALERANEAQAAAQVYADAQAEYEREVAKAYADGIVDAEEQSRIADAEAKLQIAKDDASAKVLIAQAANNGYTDSKVATTLTQAQSYADSVAQSKANVAEANAISQASTDAQNKANIAQANAATLSQQLVDGVQIGGRNAILNSKLDDFSYNNGAVSATIVTDKFGSCIEFERLSSTGGYQTQHNYNLAVGNEFTLSVKVKDVLGISSWSIGFSNGNNIYTSLSSSQYDKLKDLGDGWLLYSRTTIIDANNLLGLFGLNTISGKFRICQMKGEVGNKATDWTPAPEDVQNAIDEANTLAVSAQNSYNALTASLKSMAYQDVVELSKLGSTVIQNGMIKTTLLDANYIKSNVVNAGYINTLSLDATAIKSGTIDSARINASQILVNAGGATENYANNVAGAAVAALSIGGRNYVLNSQPAISTNEEILVSGDQLAVGLKTGDTVTFSFEGRVDQNMISEGRRGYALLFTRETGGSGYYIVCSTYFNSTDWIKFSVTGTVSENFDVAHNRIYIDFISDPFISGTGIYSVRNIKVEKGNKATDWTPAPEDLDANAQAKANIAQVNAVNYALALNKTKDTRDANENPTFYWTNYPIQNVSEFKLRTVIGVDGSSICGILVTKVPWTDSSGGAITQEFSSSDGVFVRTSVGLTGWSSWVKTENTIDAQTKANIALASAQSYADASATSKADIAQANAISIASSDAQTRASTAYNNAVSLSQQLVDGIKIGGRNLLNKSNVRLEGNSYPNGYYSISGGTFEGKEYTLVVKGYTTPGNFMGVYFNGYQQIGEIYSQDSNNIQVFHVTRNSAGAGSAVDFYHFPNGSSGNSVVEWAALYEGNIKPPLDWTPAPEDVQLAIDNASALAVSAQNSYSALTSSLKSMAYRDVVELSELGSTLIQGGKIRTTLIDADYIKANIVNAEYINTLEIVANTINATSGTISGFTLADEYILQGDYTNYLRIGLGEGQYSGTSGFDLSKYGRGYTRIYPGTIVVSSETTTPALFASGQTYLYGGVHYKVKTVGGSYSLTDNDHTVIITTGGTLYFPPDPGECREITVLKTTSAAVTINGNGKLIKYRNATPVSSAPMEWVMTFRFIGGNWQLISYIS